MKAVQHFTDEQLEEYKKLTTEQILEFQENFRQLHAPASPAKLISIRVPEGLLKSFKAKAESNGIKYQTLIKQLMLDELKKG